MTSQDRTLRERLGLVEEAIGFAPYDLRDSARLAFYEVRADALAPAAEAVEYPEAAQVCGEAYQVVGSLLSDVGMFDTEMGDKILDNLSQHRLVHKDILPWPAFVTPQPTSAAEAEINWPFTYIIPSSKHEYVPKHHAEQKIRAAYTTPQPAPVVDDAMIDRALHARVPGGADVRCWLPMLDDGSPHETAREVIRIAIRAALAPKPTSDAGEGS